MVPNAQQEVILGIPWVRDQNATYRPREDILYIEKSGTYLRRNTTPRKINMRIAPTTPSVMQCLVRQAKRGSPIRIFTASMKDIEKALEVKKEMSPEEIRRKLPPQYAEF